MERIPMNRLFKILFSFPCLYFFCAFSFAKALPDSVGVKTVEGNKFIVYKVEAKEGWFGIAKRYNLSTYELQQSNPKAGKSLKKGEELLIPMAETVDKETLKQPLVIRDPVYYDAKKKETLYSIAKNNNTIP